MSATGELKAMESTNSLEKGNAAATAVAAVATKEPEGPKKLSNKELKELKKREKAAKRSAKKQESGITIEQQQQQAEVKREKTQQQREKHLQHQRDQQKKREKRAKQNKQSLKKSSLFGHLETAAERRATFLALTSAITTPKASRITASGLMVPTIVSASSSSSGSTSGTSVASSSTPSSSAGAAGLSPGSHPPGTTKIVATNGGQQDGNSDMTKSFAGITLEPEEFSLVPGISSIIPRAIEQAFESSQLVSSVKELLLNKNLIHPAITLLTSQISNYRIVGSIPRCIAMLEAFQIVIKDYQTPPGTTLSRNLTNYLSHQIDILKKARPLSVTMGNAIRWLKQEISLIDPSTPDKSAKQDLCEKIAQFAREKIELADQLIIGTASHHIENGTTIVAYGSSKVITDLLIFNAVDLQKDFKVIVVDSRPLFEGRKMAETLRSHGVNVMYGLITGLDDIFNMDVDYIYLGAHSILSNGFLYSRVGTAMVAMTAKRRNIPVLVCCESLKFSQRVQLDSVTFNELADPDDLICVDSKKSVDRYSTNSTLLHQFLKERQEEKKNLAQESKTATKGSTSSSNTASKASSTENPDKGGKNILDDWQEIPSLNIVNILYDLTPPEYIKKIITEFGALPPSSVPVILREYKSSA